MSSVTAAGFSTVGNIGDRNFVRTATPNTEVAVVRASAGGSAASAAKAATTYGGRIGALLEKLDALQALVEKHNLRGRKGQLGLAESSDDVGLVTDATGSTLAGDDEINTLGTRVADRAPDPLRTFLGSETTGRSSFTMKILGDYTGVSTSQFKIVLNGNANITSTSLNRQLRIYGYQDENLVAYHQLLPGTFVPDAEYALADGLSFTLGAGQVFSDEYVHTTAVAGINADLDPTKPFNGQGDDHGDLPGSSPITDGAIEINGTSIDVFATDSMNDVLDRINASAAGVTATLSGDVLTLQNTAEGSLALTLGADTSGFFAATNLDSATVTLGQDDQRTLALDQVAAFSGITAGSFSLNGVEITVDPTVDSLNDVIDRVNASGAGVVAEYREATGLLRFTAASTAQDVQLSADTSGLLGANLVSEGTYESVQRRGLSAKVAEEITQAMFDVVDALNSLTTTISGESAAALIGSTRSELFSELRGLVGNDADELGLNFQHGDTSGKLVKYEDRDEQRFRRALRTSGRAVQDLLEGKGGRGGGLIDALDEFAAAARASLAAEYGAGVVASTQA
jgi:hypothetical protein